VRVEGADDQLSRPISVPSAEADARGRAISIMTLSTRVGEELTVGTKSDGRMGDLVRSSGQKPHWAWWRKKPNVSRAV